MTSSDNLPPCFGNLDKVFPETGSGFRTTPESCIPCYHKTDCLRTAMSEAGGLKFQEQNVDRAYEAGMMGFLARWSRKKNLQKELSRKKGEPS